MVLPNALLCKLKKLDLPYEFVKNILTIYGEKGERWLLELPQFLVNCEEQWHLKLAPCFRNLSFNYVALAYSNEAQVVLKCSPLNAEFYTEIAALQHFNGQGAAGIFRIDEQQGRMLLEYIDPGFSLEKFNHTKEAIDISVTVMRQLHKPIGISNETFPTLENWFKGFDRLYQKFNGTTGPFAAELIDRAQHISQELLQSQQERVLLHGDLHYGNILFSKTRGWLATDPKGVIGEPAFEIPFPKLNETITKQQLEQNLHHFIEASGFEKERVLGWLFSKAVLAAWWSYEDSGHINPLFIQCAELIKNIKL